LAEGGATSGGGAWLDEDLPVAEAVARCATLAEAWEGPSGKGSSGIEAGAVADADEKVAKTIRRAWQRASLKLHPDR
jgi:hypothetical protein